MALLRYKNDLYYKCTNIDSEDYWCATSVKPTFLEPLEKGRCEEKCNKGIRLIRSFSPHLFPFGMVLTLPGWACCTFL